MRLPLLLGFLLLREFRICHADSSEKIDHQRNTFPPFRTDLYPEEYDVNFPIPVVISDDGGNSRSSAETSSSESKSLEDATTSLFSKRHLQVKDRNKNRVSAGSSEDSSENRERGILPKLVYYRKSKTKPRKKIRKTKPKLTAFWGPPRNQKQTHRPRPHRPHHHGPPSHGPPPHGPPHYYHGPPPPHHFHHHHGHGPPNKSSHLVAIWKENQKHAPKPGRRRKGHKTKRIYTRRDLIPEYLADLAFRLQDGLGILSKPPKPHGYHGKTPVTYHSGFYTEVQ